MKPYYEQSGITIYNGSCLDILPGLSCDWIVTDPPYGVGKSGWDDVFPTDWLAIAAASARCGLAIMPGVANLGRMPHVIGEHEYRWCLAVHLTNGMARGVMGFGNWIPCMIYTREGVSIYQTLQDCVSVSIGGDMPKHPSPKPYRAMTWLLSRLPEGTIIDPFMGSGTTLRAAKDLGREAIGIEIMESYCDLAVNRLSQEVLGI